MHNACLTFLPANTIHAILLRTLMYTTIPCILLPCYVTVNRNEADVLVNEFVRPGMAMLQDSSRGYDGK